MLYDILESDESIQDIINFAIYIKLKLKNPKAADDFLDAYDSEAESLKAFPKRYHNTFLKYRGYKIRIKPFGTYNIFFVVDDVKRVVIILRVLKDLQNWNHILHARQQYHFHEINSSKS